MKTILSLLSALALAALALPQAFADQATVVQIEVPAMKCAGCAWAVDNALTKLEGVTEVHVDPASKKAVLAVTSPAAPGKKAIAEAVKTTGYEVSGYQQLKVTFAEAKKQISKKG